MTIAVVWQENGRQWCAADTLVVAGKDNAPTTEIAAKIYAIPVATSAMTVPPEIRQPHYSTQYGFVYAGAVQPASLTAITAITFLPNLVRVGERSDPPKFEEIAELVRRLANRFMADRRRFIQRDHQNENDGLFEAAFFGWCPHDAEYKIAHIKGREDGGFRVDLSFPEPPRAEGAPWLVLGAAEKAFNAKFQAVDSTQVASLIPLSVVETMVAEGQSPTVGGATSVGMAHKHGFDLFCGRRAVGDDQSSPLGIFNGLDLANDVGLAGQYFVGINSVDLPESASTALHSSRSIIL